MHAARAALRQSKAPLNELAARHGLNAKTVTKWGTIDEASMKVRAWADSSVRTCPVARTVN